MQNNEKPKVPMKPEKKLQSSSVVEAAWHFEKIASVDRKPMNVFQNKTTALKVDKHVAPNFKPTYAIVSDHPQADDGNFYEQSAILIRKYFFLNLLNRRDLNLSTESPSELSVDDTRIYEYCDNFEEFTDSTVTEDMQILNPIEEILANEKLYIKRLNFVIANYMRPGLLMGEQIKLIFGNIDEITYFHENIFYPDLQRYNNDLIRLTECFSTNIAVISNF